MGKKGKRRQNKDGKKERERKKMKIKVRKKEKYCMMLSLIWALKRKQTRLHLNKTAK